LVLHQNGSKRGASRRGDCKKDQGEFLQFQQLTFVDQVSVSQKTIVASSEEKFLTLQKHAQVQQLAEIIDLQGKTVWVIYLAQ
jgi:hypothetical protein